MTENYPCDFLNRMKAMLGDEYEEFISALQKPPYRGIRVNSIKCSGEKLKQLLDFEIKKSPFSDYSYYIPCDITGIGSSPLHHAGAFYVQEPSAASAVTVLNPQKGDKVLDLCAAPGGKSTQIAAALQGGGLLWSNEIVKSRAQILLSNIERMGVRNAVVSSCSPQKLCGSLAGFFDKVLVDAPCSGEGMFRKDELARREWSARHTESCRERQLAILNSAKLALKEGGILVYSTCTFSPLENEEVIEEFLKNNRGFDLIDCGADFGRPALNFARRIYPMDGGEGHFVAKLKKNDAACGYTPIIPYNAKKTSKDEQNAVEMGIRLIGEIFKDNNIFCESIAAVNDKVVILPGDLPDIRGLGVLRCGILLGDIKKNRVEPEHSLFMASKPDSFNNVINLSLDDDRLDKFLKGEEIETNENIKGYTAVAAEGIVTGFGKASCGVLKNKYPKGLRKKA